MVFHCARPFVFSAPFQCSAKQGREELLTAAVERGPSEGARSESKESSSCPCATPSEAARCASTRDTHTHRASSVSSCTFPLESTLPQSGVARSRLRLRASNEHLRSVRVARAREVGLATPHAPTRLELECRGHSPVD